MPQRVSAQRAERRALGQVSAEAVTRAGPLRRLRVEKDIQQLGAAVARLIEHGRPLTLDEVLADATLLDLDLVWQRAGAAGKTRENRSGILRRLQAVHRDLPWRRADGERVKDPRCLVRKSKVRGRRQLPAERSGAGKGCEPEPGRGCGLVRRRGAG